MRTYFKRSFLLGLLGLLCAAPTAFGQGYIPVGPQVGAPGLLTGTPSGVTSIPGVPKVVINPPWTPNPAPHAGGVVVGGPLGDQPTGHHVQDKHCTRVPSTDKKVRIEYGSVAIDYCMPSCNHGGCSGGCCDGEEGGCGKPRRKHFLVKREVTCECPAYDCTPACRPDACQPAAWLPPCQDPLPPAAVPAGRPGVPATMMSAPAPGTPLLTTAPVTSQGQPATAPRPVSLGAPQ
jgi:hypothetical protein